MKQFLSLTIAAIFGGAIALGGNIFLIDQQPQPQPIKTSNFQPSQVQQVKYVDRITTSNPLTMDFRAAAKKATKAVVHINSTGSNRNNRSSDPMELFFGRGHAEPIQGSGSGVIYSSDGYIVTNNHVIDFADDIQVTLSDNRKFKATLVGTNKKTDLAVLKIEANNLQTLDLANSDNAEIGEWTLAVGNPFNLTSTVTAGIISAKGRSLKLLADRDAIESFIQTDAAVNPGNSGGALVDAEGKLLGINTAIATQTGAFQGYSFAIPIDLVKRIVDDIINYGSYQRAFLGVSIYPLDSKAAKELDVDISQGVVIETIEDRGSAQYAGLNPKDIITKVNEKTVNDIPDLAEIVGRSKVGDVLDVSIVRNGEPMTIQVKMRPESNK